MAPPMAEVLEPDPGAAEGSEAPAVETPGWEVPEDAGPQFSLVHLSPEVMRSDTAGLASGSALRLSLWTGIQPCRLALQG